MQMDESIPISNVVLEEVKLVRLQIWDLLGQWHLFNDLFSSQETVNIISWGYGRGAFGLIQQAIRTELAIGVGRLLDPADEKVRGTKCHNLGVDLMICHVENFRVTKSTDMRVDLDHLRRLYVPLKRWRDKHHAHRDRATAIGPETLERVEQERLSSLFIKLGQIMNRISTALEASTTPYESAYEGAAGQILALIRPDYQASRVSLGLDE